MNKRRSKEKATQDRQEARNASAQLSIFRTIEPEGLCTIQEGEWECIELAVDSGATETVLNEEMLGSVEVVPGAGSRKGVEYEVANGTRIPNLGEKKFTGTTEEGMQRKIVAQVADVNKALMSVKKLVTSGNRVVFDTDSYIEDKETGERTWLKEDGGMYMLKMWVKHGGF